MMAVPATKAGTPGSGSIGNRRMVSTTMFAGSAHSSAPTLQTRAEPA